MTNGGFILSLGKIVCMTFTWQNETDASCAVGNTLLNIMQEKCCNLTGRLQSTALTNETPKLLEMFITKLILSLIMTLNQSASVKMQMR